MTLNTRQIKDKQLKKQKSLNYTSPLALISLTACGGEETQPSVSNIINLTGNRSDYKIDATTSGFIISTSDETISTPTNGSVAFSDGGTYLLRDTKSIIAKASSHLENYSLPDDLISSKAIWLHTGAYFSNTAHANVLINPEDILQFPSRGYDTVNTAYINISEITGVGNSDPFWNEAWDANGDNIIDLSEDQLPVYLQGLDYNTDWGNYVVNYWESEWKDVLFDKIDIVMSQNFDGVMFDVTTGWMKKIENNPNAISDMAILMEEVTSYIHNTYGNTALATFNIGFNVLQEHPELAKIIDAAYFQNSYFKWTGDGSMSESYNPDQINIIKDIFNSEGKALFVMDHLNDPTDQLLIDYLINSVETSTVPMIGSKLFENFTDYPIYRITMQETQNLSGWENTDIFYSDADTVNLSGNGGNDIFTFAVDSRHNTITDFDPNNDRVIFFDASYNVLDSSDVTKTQNSDGSLELLCSTGASVILENCETGQPINIYSEFLL